MQNQIHKFYSFDFPKIKTDFILSVGSMCRVAHHLRRNRLRELACPLDWMINDKLEVVYDLFQSDFKDFFCSCSITKQDPFEVKDNHNDMLAIHYFFPNQDLEIQAKRVNGQAIRRWNTIKNIILSSKNVVFVRSGDFDLKTASKFLQKVAKLFNKNGGGITSSMLAIMKNCKRMK
ncbi:DUF1796 family putative cysteine peptidase [Campylobacter helveticus]|uniref:DUF1796 family putative cysteine peptidase n=1 Tax=Campylobacter helveticus TaxID=28898 RepID=UPI0022EB8922|nr:DUF1796 family putative cysteine peptidase [Campylobacter helveticus]